MDACSFALQMLADMLQGFSARLLVGNDIRVEGEVYRAVSEGNIVPVSKKCDTAELVLTFETPDAGERAR